MASVSWSRGFVSVLVLFVVAGGVAMRGRRVLRYPLTSHVRRCNYSASQVAGFTSVTAVGGGRGSVVDRARSTRGAGVVGVAPAVTSRVGGGVGTRQTITALRSRDVRTPKFSKYPLV